MLRTTAVVYKPSLINKADGCECNIKSQLILPYHPKPTSQSPGQTWREAAASLPVHTWRESGRRRLHTLYYPLLYGYGAHIGVT